MPEGIFGNKSCKYIWDNLREYCEIKYLIDCPRETFQPGTDTKTNCLVLKKLTKNSTINKTTKIFLAKNCGHNKRGNTEDYSGKKLKDDFADLAKYGSKHKLFKSVSKLNNSYFVPRYYYINQNTFNSKNIKQVYEIKQKMQTRKISDYDYGTRR